MMKARTALLSVYDKSGVDEFAAALHDRGLTLLSTGGTARQLRDAGVSVTEVGEVTGQAEMLGGRVKTLHPKIFGGILARREVGEQMQELETASVAPIDVVVVNLYPFAATIADPEHSFADALEQIDIGGVALLRAAAKNFPGVIVLVDPADYPAALAMIDGDGGDANESSHGERRRLAAKAIAHTAAYDAAISQYLGASSGAVASATAAVATTATPERDALPERLQFSFERRQVLRYGENPHQRAAFYVPADTAAGIAAAEQLNGKELSYNNILDADAAWMLARWLPQPGAAVIKHMNPCGAGTAPTLAAAYVKARATDPTSAFGGIVALNEVVNEETAHEIASTFIEVVVAPDFSSEALEVLRAKAALRLLRVPEPAAPLSMTSADDLELRGVVGGLLVQERDPGAGVACGAGGEGRERWECVSVRRPTPQEDADLRFLWSVVPAVRSNAIVVGRDGQLLGVGAGQMSRVDSCRFAVWKAREAGHELGGAAAASDAFFPFADGVESLAEAGVSAVVQPGGSKRDPEVIAAADRLGLALVHTGARHFRH